MKQYSHQSNVRSDSEGNEDEELTLKRKFPRTFHVLPSAPTKLVLWLNNIGIKDFQASNYAKICLNHFTEDCIDRTSSQMIKLRSEHSLLSAATACLTSRHTGKFLHLF